MSDDFEGQSMSNWFDTIITRITMCVRNRPLLVIDPQHYLEMKEFQMRLRQEGYTIYFSNGGIDARMIFEGKARGNSNVILDVLASYKPLDDLKAESWVLEILAKDLFSCFDVKAINGLSFNALSIIDSLPVFNKLSFDDTVVFLLENLYAIDFNAWRLKPSKERCLAMLISVFTSPENTNTSIREYLITLAKSYFGEFARELCNKEKLIDFVDNLNEGDYGLNLEEPILNKEIAKLKISGIISNDNSGIIEKQNTAKDLIIFIENEVGRIEDQLEQWFSLTPQIGKLGSLVYELQDEEIEIAYDKVIEKINNRFQHFVDSKYEQLFSYSASIKPITIDKIQEFISNNNESGKFALIVIDGMNFWQWAMLKHSLTDIGINVEEKASFTWLPSITAWARQSIFRGKKPDENIDNKSEGEFFFNFWNGKRQIQPYQFQFKKLDANERLKVPDYGIKVAGFVYNALDQMMHGSILGNKQLYQSTALWIKESGIAESIKALKDSGFDIYISTDHGNIDARLNCKMTAGEKTVSLTRSKRFVRFDTVEQAQNFIDKNTAFSLGRRGNSVYFKDTNGIGNANMKEITHGGSHILELIIPLGVIK